MAEATDGQFHRGDAILRDAEHAAASSAPARLVPARFVPARFVPARLVRRLGDPPARVRPGRW